MKKKRSVKPTEPRREKLGLADLVPHPDQDRYFRRYGESQYAALKNDIAKNGLRHPIEVMPPENAAGLAPHMILTGHTRWKILQELGHATTEALVRYDLAGATRAQVDEIFLNDNSARRQQTPLEQARAAIRQFEIEREGKGRRVIGDPLQYSELRGRLVQILDMCPRNLKRYLNVLVAPVEVQDALQDKRVKLETASKVAGLKKSDQDKLAERLRDGEDASTVFAEFFPPRGNKHVKTADAVAALARSLERAGSDFDGRIEKVKPGPVQRNEEALRAGLELIRALLDRGGMATK